MGRGEHGAEPRSAPGSWGNCLAGGGGRGGGGENRGRTPGGARGGGGWAWGGGGGGGGGAWPPTGEMPHMHQALRRGTDLVVASAEFSD